MTPAPEAVLFDWDNTLIDGWTGITSALNVVLRTWDLAPWTLAEAKARIRGSVRDSFPDLFGPDWRRAADMLRQTMSSQDLAHLTLMPGAEALVAAAVRLPCAVVSNKEGGNLRREVAHLGWTLRFGAIVGAGDASADKPSPAPIWHALQRIGVKPSPAVWYVGDTGSDMLAARRAGCLAVLVGDAAHDGGLAALEQMGATPHLQWRDASALAAHLMGGAGSVD